MTNEELKREIEQLKQVITEMRINWLESRGEPIPYQVKIPSDLENYYTIDIDGSIEGLYGYTNEIRVLFYQRGLAFKTKTEAEQHFKKSMLLFKMHKWAEEYNEDWTPDWNDDDETIYEVQIDRFPMYGCDSPLVINEVEEVCSVSIFPYFYSHETAREFIDEFRGEIEEVFL